MSKSIQQLGNIIDPENGHDNPEEVVQKENKIDDTLAQGGSAATHQGVIETVGADIVDATNAPQLDQEVFDLAYSMRTAQPDRFYHHNNRHDYVVEKTEKLGVERMVNAIISSHTGDRTVDEHFELLASNMLKYCNAHPRGDYNIKVMERPEVNLTDKQTTQLLDYLIDHDVRSAYLSVCYLDEQPELREKAIAAIIEQRNARAADYYVDLVRHFVGFEARQRLIEWQEKAVKAMIAPEEAES